MIGRGKAIEMEKRDRKGVSRCDEEGNDGRET